MGGQLMLSLIFLKTWKVCSFLKRQSYNVLDSAILCVDWNDDKALPSLNDCKKRQGIEC